MNIFKKFLCSFVLMASCSFVFSSDKCPECQVLYEKKGEHKEIVLHQSLDKKEKCSLCAKCAKMALNKVFAIDENNPFKKKQCSECKKIYNASCKECDTCFHSLALLDNDMKKCVNAACEGWSSNSDAGYFNVSRDVNPTAANTKIEINTKKDNCPVCGEKLVKLAGKTCFGCSKIYSVDKQVCLTCKNNLDAVFTCPGKNCNHVHMGPELQKIKNNLWFCADDDDDEDEGACCILCTQPFDDGRFKRIPLHPQIHNEQNDDEKECNCEHAVCQECFIKTGEIQEINDDRDTRASKKCPLCNENLADQWPQLEKFTLDKNCCKKCKKVSPYLIKIHPRGDKKSKDSHSICVDCWVDGLTVGEACNCPCCSKKIEIPEWIQLNKPVAGACSLCHTLLNDQNKVNLSPDALEDKDKHWICVDCVLKGIKNKNYRICVPCLQDSETYTCFEENTWKRIAQEVMKTVCIQCLSAQGVIKLHPKELDEKNQHRVCLDCFCKGQIDECPDKECKKVFNYCDCVNQLPNGYCHICCEKLGSNEDRIALNPSGKDDAEKQVICLSCFYKGQKSELARLNPCIDKVLSLEEWNILFYTQLLNGYCFQCCKKLGNNGFKFALNPSGQDDAERQVICSSCFYKGQESEQLRLNPCTDKILSLEEWNILFYTQLPNGYCHACCRELGRNAARIALNPSGQDDAEKQVICLSCFHKGQMSEQERRNRCTNKILSLEEWNARFYDHACYDCEKPFGQQPKFALPDGAVNTVKNACLCKTCLQKELSFKNSSQPRPIFDRSLLEKDALNSLDKRIFRSMVPDDCCKKCAKNIGDDGYILHSGHGLCKTCFEKKYEKCMGKMGSHGACLCPACDKVLLMQDMQQVLSTHNVCASCFKKIETDKSDSYIKLHRPQGCKKNLMICRECYEKTLKDNGKDLDIVCPCCRHSFTRLEWEFLDARCFIREKIKSEIKSAKDAAGLVCDHVKKTYFTVRTQPLVAGLIIASGVGCNLMSRYMLNEFKKVEHLSGKSAMLLKTFSLADSVVFAVGPFMLLAAYATELDSLPLVLYSIGFGAAAGAPLLYRILQSSAGPRFMRVIRAAQALWSNKIRPMNGRQPLPSVFACQGRA